MYNLLTYVQKEKLMLSDTCEGMTSYGTLFIFTYFDILQHTEYGKC